MEHLPDTVFYILDPWAEMDRRMVQNANSWAVFHEFIRDTYPVVRQFNFSHIPAHSENFAVIIEPRRHCLLEYVLRNVMHFLGDGWGLQIFTCRDNEDYVRQITDGWKTVHIDILAEHIFDRAEFEKFRKSTDFWRRMRGERLLCFETDSILCRRGINEYMSFDYIGAPWNEKQFFNRNVRIGNGGLSFRRKSAMIDICTGSKPWVVQPEDSFFSINLQLRKDEFVLPDIETAMSFSVETLFHPNPLGLHKPWMYMNESQMRDILSTVDYG